ncbi:HTH La-type RNA-binding domain-containing protein [Trichonephila clavata]|uniref:HTH La-type RNA-binding domain-containing protein n=1 Tax=Trichonephila clavata TaxID=2740835 RepID=A0A8X6FLX0_TRICU|nr:HTH La-type RNA-binding domain-containing protein [Trichonephila clavata]
MKGKVSTAFSLITDHRIMNHIRTCTIEEANRVLGSDWSLSQEKLDAFIAILYARAAYGANNLKISFLWNNIWGPKFFSETKSRNNFTEILRFIRVDKKSQWSQRLKTDKFATVFTIWNIFIENSHNCYKPGGNITIDEQLFPTKVRCRFTQYMPNKPDKFGIKFWLASDVDSKYVINALPYLGKDENRPSSVQLSEYVVLKLIEPFTGCGRTVTSDSFFTSKSLAIQLLANKTTLVGIIRPNKRELPLIAKQKKDNMARFSSKIFTTDNCTRKPNKNVLLLNSKHKFVTVENNDKRLPETVSY